jgi:hypothetical protein
MAEQSVKILGKAMISDGGDTIARFVTTVFTQAR